MTEIELLKKYAQEVTDEMIEELSEDGKGKEEPQDNYVEG